MAQGEVWAEVARRLEESRVTSKRRFGAWRKKGLQVPEWLGRPPELRGRDLERFDRQLRTGAGARGHETELWPLQCVAEFFDVHRWSAELLPDYAPELNPVEPLWAWTRTDALAHRGEEQLAALVDAVRRASRRAQRRPDLDLGFLAKPGPCS